MRRSHSNKTISRLQLGPQVRRSWVESAAAVPCPRDKLRMTVKPYRPKHPQAATAGMIPFETILRNNIHKKTKTDLNIRLQSGTFLLTPVRIAHAQDVKQSAVTVPRRPLIEELFPERTQGQTWAEVKAEVTEEAAELTGIFRSKIFARRNFEREQLEAQERERDERRRRLTDLLALNDTRCRATPVYGLDLVEAVTLSPRSREQERLLDGKREEVANMLFLNRFHLFVPTVMALDKNLNRPVTTTSPLISVISERTYGEVKQGIMERPKIEFNLQLPETRLIQYDCGKLQVKMIGNLTRYSSNISTSL